MIQVQVALDSALDGTTNMARDTELLGRAESGEVGARIYFWDGPWISIGKFQCPTKAVLSDQVPYVKRPTGGKAVLHGHDVGIGIAVPLALIDCSPREVKKAYRLVSRPIIGALNAAGLNADLAEATDYVNRGQKTADCFAFNSANDIVDVDTGHKLCGCALQLTESALLLQASIPNGPPLVDPKSVMRDASGYIGPVWDSSQLKAALEEGLVRLLQAN